MKPMVIHRCSGTEYFCVSLPKKFTDEIPDIKEKNLKPEYSGGQITYTVIP